MSQPYILYGAPCSLYTGKARAYLLCQGIGFREIAPGAEHFVNAVVPAVHRWRIPVMERPEGGYIQDSTMIIAHFENQPEIAATLPDTPGQRIAALLMDLIGAEGLLRPAMHYRWNFDEENEAFLLQNFRTLVPGGSEEMTREAMESMRQAAVSFGVLPGTVPVVEAVYEELLDLMNAHFARYPYLLGGRPCIGDFGMIAPFYAHLARDPYPADLMKKRAPWVFRWTERMNRPDSDMGEFRDFSPAFLEDDAIPETLKAVLRFISRTDLVAETEAAGACINQWLAENRPAPGERAKRGVGFAEFDIRGVPVKALAQPYRFFLLQRVQSAYAALDKAGQAAARKLLEEVDAAPLLSLSLDREITRQDNLEVWGENHKGLEKERQ